MKVASIITITDREDFNFWLDSLDLYLYPKERYKLCEKAKVSNTALWSVTTGFLFW